MATVGAFVVDMYMNNQHYLAGVKAATSSTKRMESEISASIAKINAKQLKNVANQMLGSLSVVGMFQAGAKMATELVKGFNSEAIKGFGDAMNVLGNTLVSAIRALPIAGAFLQLGEEIGKAVFGDAQKQIDDMIAAMNKLDAALKTIKAPNVTIASTLEAMQSQITNFGESDKAKERRLFIERIKKEQDLANKAEILQRLGNVPKEFNVHKTEVRNPRTGAIENVVETKTKNLDYEKQLLDYKARQLSIGKEIAAAGVEKLTAATVGFDQAAAQYQILVDQKQAQDVLLKQQQEIHEAQKKAAADAAKAIIEQIKHEKDLARERLQQLKVDSLHEAIDAYEALTAAEYEHQEKVANIKKESGRSAGAVGLSTAIGTVKVAAVVDFGVQKQLDLAAQMLKEAKENNEYLQEINDSIRAIASIP